MTAVECLQRLKELVEETMPPDQIDLLAFCSDEIKRREKELMRLTEDHKYKTNLRVTERKESKHYVYEVLQYKRYMPLCEILNKLDTEYPFREWSRVEVIRMLNMLLKENKVEKYSIRYYEPTTNRVLMGIAYRRVKE